MKKTDKKLDKSVREALTEVCEIALEREIGFQWITHFANYASFPDSLSITCVLDTNKALLNLLNEQMDNYLLVLIRDKLAEYNIFIKNINKHVSFDSEEACNIENDGKWNQRLKSKSD